MLRYFAKKFTSTSLTFKAMTHESVAVIIDELKTT